MLTLSAGLGAGLWCFSSFLALFGARLGCHAADRAFKARLLAAILLKQAWGTKRADEGVVERHRVGAKLAPVAALRGLHGIMLRFIES